ncbi:hypothetical protein HNQ93_000537 [Hymenobacter luteus]|uniref:Uncharacterized protein n=2 Tax=Hymenobacter TaxID=89966 RepID=A0A7W9SXG1_9BACT|nr:MULTISPECIES: hypothetical protein [Hymenobacter]MBB4599983.1 hypothetical protein [Hymenobacter latericoloratus]MBB6057707.1 hypothetical protein [Hymenobacter luteus]
MIAALIKSYKKSWKLKRLSKKLSEPLNMSDFLNVTTQLSSKDLLEEELLDLCMQDAVRQQVIAKYNVGRKDLKSIYGLLSGLGAGQWAGGHYVSASSLVYAQTLDYLLRIYTSHEKTNKDVWVNAAYRLIIYFEKGETGLVKD